MGNPQNIKFKNVDECLAYLPEDELEIVLFLRRIILECMPDCKEKLAYNVPFYYRYSRICYIWPASIPWGKIEKGVSIGFCRGDLITEDTIKTSKTISKLTYNSLNEIDVEVLKQQVYEAIMIDKNIVNARKRRIQ